MKGSRRCLRRHDRLARATRAGAAALGLKLFPKESSEQCAHGH